MSDTPDLDRIRRQVLDDAAFWERAVYWLFGAAAVAELGLGITFILLLDFSDRLHLLIFFAVLTIYIPVVLFLASIYGAMDRNTGRILRAIEEAGRKEAKDVSRGDGT